MPSTIWDILLKLLGGQIPLPTVSFLGLPGYVFFLLPFIIGIVLGFLIKKALKIAIIAVIVVAAALYLGIVSMSQLNNYLTMIEGFGPEAIQYAAIFFGMLPLGLGFLVGLLIGLKFG